MTKKFELGQLVATRGVSDFIASLGGVGDLLLSKCVQMHASGDWGLVDDEDKQTNDRAVINGDRIMSAYEIQGKRIWIITEWDRSVTTVLFPDEY